MKNRIIMNIIPEIVFKINYNIFAVNRSIFGSLVKKITVGIYGELSLKSGKLQYTTICYIILLQADDTILLSAILLMYFLLVY